MGFEIFGDEAHRVAFDAGVDVFGDEDDVIALLLEGGGAADDAVVGRIGGQAWAEFLVFFENHADSAAGLGELDAFGEFSLEAERIEMADDGSGVAAQVVGVGFEFVQFLDDIEWDDDFVVGEHEEGVGIVKQDVGVENEVLDVAVGWGHVESVQFCFRRSVCIRRRVMAKCIYVSLST